uniref:Uncharacterized protein n=1 Tax=Percolomonas cosmopolitus TaxID=63605 RepID=A0A7S1KT97_9EUKA|mmetsp:Transcript_8629/g.31895  ORF Transcript_8629/g.31895 Transcript_8629/m.31895 type:complete len:221 (+) Transcript_8629:123-785(+)
MTTTLSGHTTTHEDSSSLVYRHHIQKTLIASLPKNSLLRSSLSFFHDNLQYFSTHPFEFSRLVAQLENESERERMRELVWIYWSRDVLVRRPQGHHHLLTDTSSKSLHEALAQSAPHALVHKKHMEYLNSQLVKGDQSTIHSSPLQHPHDEQQVRIQLFNEAFQLLKSHHKKLSVNSHQLFYNMILQLNWRESVLLERMWEEWLKERSQHDAAHDHESKE